MNETERERIMQMVSDGTLRPNEAAQLLAALSEHEATATPASPQPNAAAQKPAPKKPELMEVQMQRPDGSHYTVEVPPSLVPMLMKMAGVAIKESARTATIEAWGGFKTMVRNKTDEVKETVTNAVNKPKAKPAATASAAKPQADSSGEARRQIIQMVQNGRISAADASRLIEQLDALQDYNKSQPAPAK